MRFSASHCPPSEKLAPFTQLTQRYMVAAVVLSMAAAAFAATTASDPYVPGEGKQALADELSLPLGEFLVDRRCVYTRTDHRQGTCQDDEHLHRGSHAREAHLR